MTRQILQPAVYLAALLAACGPSRAPAAATPAPAASSAPTLTGTWVLTAADEIRPDGTRAQSYGTDPRGLLIVDGDGRYSLQIFRSGRLRFASGDKRRGNAEEYADAVLGMSSHAGRCFIDPVTHELIFRIELASYPNWEGTEQHRVYRLTADSLSYRIAASATGNGTIAISEWRRVR